MTIQQPSPRPTGERHGYAPWPRFSVCPWLLPERRWPPMSDAARLWMQRRQRKARRNPRVRFDLKALEALERIARQAPAAEDVPLPRFP